MASAPSAGSAATAATAIAAPEPGADDDGLAIQPLPAADGWADTQPGLAERPAAALPDHPQAWAVQALWQASPLGMLVTDTHGRASACNPRFARLLGHRLDDAAHTGQGWAERVEAAERETVRDDWIRSVAQRSVFDHGLRARGADGVLRRLRMRARPHFSASGEFRGHVAMVEDISAAASARRQLDALLEALGEQHLVSVSDAQGRVVEANAAFRSLFSAAGLDPIGQPHPLFQRRRPGAGRSPDGLLAALARGQRWRGELRGEAVDGRPFRLDCVLIPLVAEDGTLERCVMVADDSTVRHQQAEALARANERFLLASDSGGIGVWEYEPRSGALLWDARVCRLFGQPEDSAPRRLDDWRAQVHPEDWPNTERAWADALRRLKPFDIEYRVYWPDGSQHHLRATARVRSGADGRAVRVVGVAWDVTDLRRLSSDLAYRSTHDALTGLPNRAEFEARLQRLLVRAQQDGGMHALLYLDLDQFKLVNDTSGHSAGDQLLREVGRLLADSVRGRDTLARLGGDEFGILLEHCGPEQAGRIAHKVCERLGDYRFSHGTRRHRVGASIGLVPVDRRWPSVAAILQAADSSCYAAKEAGRRRVHAWLDSDQAMRHRHGEMQWAAGIEQALDDGRFELHAQRVVPLRGDVGPLRAEVLLRMVMDDGTRVSPTAFLPAAERFHLAARIDRWVLRSALDWMAQQPSLDRLALLSVNLSGQSLSDRDFHTWAAAQLAAAVPAIRNRLGLEVTETAAVTNLADAQRFIASVRAAGVKVALDDFGAGASSFGYLKSLSVDCLKIDGRFVRELAQEPLAEVAVRAFVAVAQVVGVPTVAEFVDNQAAHDRLAELGVDLAQGHLLHRPAPLHELSLALRVA